MTVSHVFDNEKVHEVKWVFSEQRCDVEVNDHIKKILSLNSRSEFDSQDPEPNMLKKKTFGDASESGILRFM